MFGVFFETIFESFSRCHENHLRSFDFEWFFFVYGLKKIGIKFGEERHMKNEQEL